MSDHDVSPGAIARRRQELSDSGLVAIARLLIRAEREGAPLMVRSGLLEMPKSDGCCEVNCAVYADLSDLYELLDLEEEWARETRETLPAPTLPELYPLAGWQPGRRR